MKKIFATLMTICMLVGALYVNAFALEDLPGTPRRFGSIFGEGSLPMIVALIALIVSVASIFLTVYYNKKK